MKDKKQWALISAFLLAGLFLLVKPVQDLDELWNYGFAGYIFHGMVPYRDFNMVQTPLSAWLGAVWLSLFGQDLWVFRLLGALLFGAVFGIMHLLLCRITGSRVVAFVAASFSAALCWLIWMYNYNHLNLLVLLLCLYLRYLTEQQDKKKVCHLRWIISLLWGLTPAIKQSTGAVMLVFHLVSCLLEWRGRKQSAKAVLLQIVFAVMPGAAFMLWLAVSGALPDFWDYAVAGVGTFTHSQSWVAYIFFGPIDFAVGCFPVLVTVLSIRAIYKNSGAVSWRYHAYCLCACWAGAFVAYPICDFVHMCVAAVPFVIPLLCCTGEIRLTRKEKAVCWIVASLVLSFPGVLGCEKLPMYKTCELSCYNGLPIEPELENQLRAVGNYVEQMGNRGLEVLIADPSAAAYMLPTGRYYRDFNLLLVGNVGTKTAQQLLCRENAVYLILPADAPKANQSHEEVIGYIREHYEKIGEVSCFEAYASN